MKPSPLRQLSIRFKENLKRKKCSSDFSPISFLKNNNNKNNKKKIKLFDKIIKLLKKKSHVTMRLGFGMEKTKEREKADIGK